MVIGGVTITLAGVVDLIILIGALCAAVYKIWDFFAKPTSAIKQKRIDRQKALILAVLRLSRCALLYPVRHSAAITSVSVK